MTELCFVILVVKFNIELLGICYNQEDADHMENFFIRELNSIKNGYNILEYAFSRKGTKHSKSTLKKMSNARKGSGNANAVLTASQAQLMREEYDNFMNPNTGTKYGAITKLAKKI